MLKKGGQYRQCTPSSLGVEKDDVIDGEGIGDRGWLLEE